MCPKIILKVTTNQGFTLSLEETFFEKPQGGGVKLTLPAVLGLKEAGSKKKCNSYSSTNKLFWKWKSKFKKWSKIFIDVK